LQFFNFAIINPFVKIQINILIKKKTQFTRIDELMLYNENIIKGNFI